MGKNFPSTSHCRIHGTERRGWGHRAEVDSSILRAWDIHNIYEKTYLGEGISPGSDTGLSPANSLSLEVPSSLKWNCGSWEGVWAGDRAMRWSHNWAYQSETDLQTFWCERENQGKERQAWERECRVNQRERDREQNRNNVAVHEAAT